MSRNSLDEKSFKRFSSPAIQHESSTGVYHDYDGNIYEGNWLNNMKHGFGKQIFINGDVYTGEWKDGMMDGEGTLVFSSGNHYKGNFVKGFK